MTTTKTTQQNTAAQQQLVVRYREESGRGVTARLRSRGLIPGIIYGKSTKPLPIMVNTKELASLLHSKSGEHSLVSLKVQELPVPGGSTASGTSWERPALLKAMQHDPVSGHIIHLDFHAIELTQRLKVKVPVILKGEPAGVKQEGGVLEHFLREVEVECLPTEIPAHLELEVGALKIGEAIHVRELAHPSTVQVTSDPTLVIVSVQAPKEEKPEAETVVAEPEVLREKKPEAETPAAEEGKAQASEPK